MTTPDGGNREAALVTVRRCLAAAGYPNGRDVGREGREALDEVVASMDAEAQRLRAEVESTKPEWDATDGAHPCWWRGHDNGARGMEAKMSGDLAALRAENAALRGAMERVGTLANEAYEGTESPATFRQIVAIAEVALEATTPGRTGELVTPGVPATVPTGAGAGGEGLTFSSFAKANRERCEASREAGGFGRTLPSMSVEAMALAAAGEMGEICDGIYNWVHNQGKGIAVADVIDEIGDTAAYLDLLAQRLGSSLADAIVRKWNRVSEKRGYPGRLAYPGPAECPCKYCDEIRLEYARRAARVSPAPASQGPTEAAPSSSTGEPSPPDTESGR
jgi:NTP pyrophosphatase (non-canonical NTP hydrolase)